MATSAVPLIGPDDRPSDGAALSPGGLALLVGLGTASAREAVRWLNDAGYLVLIPLAASAFLSA